MYYGLNCDPLKFVCWSINPQGDDFWRWVPWDEVQMRPGGWGLYDRISGLIGRAIRGLAFSLSLPCEETVKKQPSAHQEESSQYNLTMVAPKSWTSSLQDCEEIDFCCLSNTVNSILLWLWGIAEYSTPKISMTILSWVFLRTPKKLWKIRSCPFVRDIYIYKENLHL